MSQTSGQILKVEGVSKRFGGVLALNHVDFDLDYGEVHALVGENGAGKSTLMNILGGIVQRDSGRVVFKGQETNFKSPIEFDQRRYRRNPPGTGYAAALECN